MDLHILNVFGKNNYVNRNFSHKDHLKKILNAEEESMELRKEIETLRKEVRRFDLHTANVYKAEELLIVTICHDHEQRKNSYRLIAEQFMQ